jgi:hypothetical protein
LVFGLRNERPAADTPKTKDQSPKTDFIIAIGDARLERVGVTYLDARYRAGRCWGILGCGRTGGGFSGFFLLALLIG